MILASSKASSPGTNWKPNAVSHSSNSNVNSGSKETLRIRNQIKNQAMHEMEFQQFQVHEKFRSDFKTPSFSLTSPHVSSVHSSSAKKNVVQVSMSASKGQHQRKSKLSIHRLFRPLPASMDQQDQDKKATNSRSLSSGGTVIVPQFQSPTFPSQCSSPKMHKPAR